MKNILLLAGAALVMQVTPVLADGHKDGHKGKKFEMHDTNGDGTISEAEYLEHAKKRFQERDTNGDGSISKEEGKAAMDAKHEKRKAMKEKMRDKMKEKRAEKMQEATE